MRPLLLLRSLARIVSLLLLARAIPNCASCGPPLCTAPSPAGYARHVQGPGDYWLGCSPDPPSDEFKMACEPGGKTDVVEFGDP